MYLACLCLTLVNFHVKDFQTSPIVQKLFYVNFLYMHAYKYTTLESGSLGLK